jgi:hypothetical protein
MYRIWRSKQHSGFCGTRVQVRGYSGDPFPDERCPNCGRRESASHLVLCMDTSRTQLFGKNVADLTAWMSQDNKTDPEILYWIPKYILMRGGVPLSVMGSMSPQFRALATSQDLIGWRDFTVGHISTHFYAIQSFHLAMSISYLNGEDWIRQFISRILQLTHLQWIFRNISFHDKTNRFLRNKKANEILQLINEFAEVAPEDVPSDSRFLLEIKFSELTKAHLETQTYWTLAVDAAIAAKALELARGARAKQICSWLNTKIPSQSKLGITAVQQQIRKDGMHKTTSQSDALQASNSAQLTIDRFVKNDHTRHPSWQT